MVPEDRSRELEKLAAQLLATSNQLNASMHPVMRKTLGDLVRSMNCYYSNLIEGHHTHPVDINRALAGDYSTEPEKRNLQLEAVAHIEVQRQIDAGTISNPTTSREFITYVHRTFCNLLPDELLWVENPDTHERLRVMPGAFRTRRVRVGHHIPPPAEEIDAMLQRFNAVYGGHALGTLGRIIASGAAHHRLLWVHPFLDGNGRVARLFSHAFLRELGIGCELWSISRGLARNVERYKELLMAADEPRHGDVDGRGALSLKALEQFCGFFLRTCLDQVEFMGVLLDRQAMLARMEVWTEEQQRLGNLAPGSWPLLREAVLVGEFVRGKAPALTGYKDRQARTVLANLIKMGALVSDTPLGPVRLTFPDSVVERWLPMLYPTRP